MTFGGETAESYYDEGITASMKGDIPLAIKHFERALQLDRNFAGAYHQLGKCYLRLGEAKKAVQLLERVVQARPKLLPVRIDLGYANLQVGNVIAARHAFDQIQALKPGNPRVQLGYAYCAFLEGNWSAALDLAQDAIAQGGTTFAAFYLLGRAAKMAGRLEIMADALKRAEALMEKYAETNTDAPEGHYLRGEVLFAQERFSDAIEHYRAAEERAKQDKHYTAYGEHFKLHDVMAKRGLCLQKLGENDAAEEIGKRILAKDPQHKMGQILAKEDPA